jgi:hypothetical protein
MDEREVRAYEAVRAIFENHLHLHHLRLSQASTVAVSLVAHGGAQLHRTGHDIEHYPAQCCAMLHALVREASGFAWPEDDGWSTPTAEGDLQAFMAIAMHLAETSTETGLDLASGINICLKLLADLLTTMARALDYDEGELDAFIDETVCWGISRYLFHALEAETA